MNSRNTVQNRVFLLSMCTIPISFLDLFASTLSQTRKSRHVSGTMMAASFGGLCAKSSALLCLLRLLRFQVWLGCRRLPPASLHRMPLSATITCSLRRNANLAHHWEVHPDHCRAVFPVLDVRPCNCCPSNKSAPLRRKRHVRPCIPTGRYCLRPCTLTSQPTHGVRL